MELTSERFVAIHGSRHWQHFTTAHTVLLRRFEISTSSRLAIQTLPNNRLPKIAYLLTSIAVPRAKLPTDSYYLSTSRRRIASSIPTSLYRLPSRSFLQRRAPRHT